MQINEHGFWENDTDEGHGVDPLLAEALAKFFLEKAKASFYLNVCDLGCGTGYYTDVLNKLDDGNEDISFACHGYDGNPYTREFCIPSQRDNIGFLDLTLPTSLTLSFDWALSLEVGEHIPVEFEQTFLNTLCKVKKGVILSWAIPGQGGDGHVNCRDNIYIILQMKKRGFTIDEDATKLLRNAASPYPETGWWFKNTLMVFNKESNGL